jgi:tetratricopeptide (TPR) repeat protein
MEWTVNQRKLILLALAALLLWGCAGIRGAYDDNVRGPWYMRQGKYAEGLAAFGQELKEHPDSMEAAYWTGRYRLALNQPEEAAPLLERAVRLAPDDAEAHYWLGVCYWALGRWDDERAEYEKALALEPDNLGANLYLGHNYLDRGQWEKALAQYDRVLQLDGNQPEALFDRAVALDNLQRTAEARTAWKAFLDRHPEGGMALTAADELNALGDFSYRNVLVGQRRVTLQQIGFDVRNGVDSRSLPSLALLGAMLANNTDLVLHVVVYVQGEPATAKARSLAVQRAILAGTNGLDAGRLPLSWFGSAEKVTAGGRTWSISESVNFVTQVP